MSFLTEPQIQNAHIQIILAWVWLKDIMEQCQKNSIMQLYKHTGTVIKLFDSRLAYPNSCNDLKILFTLGYQVNGERIHYNHFLKLIIH